MDTLLRCTNCFSTGFGGSEEEPSVGKPLAAVNSSVCTLRDSQSAPTRGTCFLWPALFVSARSCLLGHMTLVYLSCDNTMISLSLSQRIGVYNQHAADQLELSESPVEYLMVGVAFSN